MPILLKNKFFLLDEKLRRCVRQTFGYDEDDIFVGVPSKADEHINKNFFVFYNIEKEIKLGTWLSW